MGAEAVPNWPCRRRARWLFSPARIYLAPGRSRGWTARGSWRSCAPSRLTGVTRSSLLTDSVSRWISEVRAIAISGCTSGRSTGRRRVTYESTQRGTPGMDAGWQTHHLPILRVIHECRRPPALLEERGRYGGRAGAGREQRCADSRLMASHAESTRLRRTHGRRW